MSSEVRVAGSNCNNFYPLVEFVNSSLILTLPNLEAFYTSIHPTTSCTECPVTRCFQRTRDLLPTIHFMNRIRREIPITAERVTKIYRSTKHKFQESGPELGFYTATLFTIAAKEFLTCLEQAQPTDLEHVRTLYREFRKKLPQNIRKAILERKEKDALFLTSQAVFDVYGEMVAGWEEDHQVAADSQESYAPARILPPKVMEAVRQVKADFNDFLPQPNIVPDDLVNPHALDEVTKYEIAVAERAGQKAAVRELRSAQIKRGIQQEMGPVSVMDRNPVIRKILADYQENLL